MRRKHPNTQISTTLKNSNASSSLSSTSYFPANNSKASGDVVAFYEEGTSRTVGIHHASGGNSSHPSPNHNRHQEHTDLEDGEDGEEDGNYQGMGERKESAESSSSWNSMSSSYECVFCGQSFVTHGKMMSHLMKCPKAG